MDFFTNYERLCRRAGLSPNGAARVLGFPSSSVTQWKHGSTPRADALEKIAEFFKVSTSYLLFGIEQAPETQKPATSGDGHINMTEQQKEALSLISQLTDQEVSIVLSQLKGILQDRSAPGDPKE